MFREGSYVFVWGSSSLHGTARIFTTDGEYRFSRDGVSTRVVHSTDVRISTPCNECPHNERSFLSWKVVTVAVRRTVDATNLNASSMSSLWYVKETPWVTKVTKKASNSFDQERQERPVSAADPAIVCLSSCVIDYDR
jgi:hypothetical protein